MVVRHLEKIRVLIKDALGLDISYAYDDLVFPEHSDFVIRFDDADSNSFFFYSHEACNVTDADKLFSRLSSVCALNRCTLTRKGRFAFRQEGERLRVLFQQET